MKNIAIVILMSLVIVVFLLVLFSFQVRETESAFVTRFGKPIHGGKITKPGLYFKWPPPIDNVHRFDSRMMTLEAELGETSTKGAVPIILNTYVVWKIVDPLQFFTSVGTVKGAETKLRSRINDTQSKVIGKHSFSEFVNADPTKIKFEQIQTEMLDDLKETIKTEYGIEIVTLGIKQLKISKDVSTDVFARMEKERNRRTVATKAQGDAQAVKIRTDANAKRQELLAAAEARAKAIRGEGDAEAAKYYKMLEDNPELAIFLRNLEALKKTLKQRTTLVIPADAEPFNLLKNVPEFKQEN